MLFGAAWVAHYFWLRQFAVDQDYRIVIALGILDAIIFFEIGQVYRPWRNDAMRGELNDPGGEKILPELAGKVVGGNGDLAHRVAVLAEDFCPVFISLRISGWVFGRRGGPGVCAAV